MGLKFSVVSFKIFPWTHTRFHDLELYDYPELVDELLEVIKHHYELILKLWRKHNMFDKSDRYALNALHEIKDLIKTNPVYYTIIDEIINQIEKPITYDVLIRSKDGRLETHREISKISVGYNYLNLKKGKITLCYNMDELLFYRIIEIEKEA